MGKKFDLDFCYKGSRKYIHGTDIFSKLTERFGEDITDIDIAFHDITVNNLTFADIKSEEESIKVTFRCSKDTEKLRLYGFENNREVTCQYDYFEEQIVNSSYLSLPEQAIALNHPTEYSFIEHIVAMNKALMEMVYPKADGKWYFTRLQLKRDIDMSLITSLKLVLESNFQFKLIKSSIMANGEKLGSIYFSLVSKGE